MVIQAGKLQLQGSLRRRCQCPHGELWLCPGTPERVLIGVEIKKEFEMTAKDGAFDLKPQCPKQKFSISLFRNNIPGKKDHGGFFCDLRGSRWQERLVFAAFKLGLPCVIISNQTSIESFFKKVIPFDLSESQ